METRSHAVKSATYVADRQETYLKFLHFYCRTSSDRTTCLRQIGAIRATDAVTGVALSKSYYAMGIDQQAAQCGPQGNLTCVYYTFNNDGTGNASCSNGLDSVSLASASVSKPVMGSVATFSTYELANPGIIGGPNTCCSMQQNWFLACAIGSVGVNGNYDVWTIDQNKNLQNTQSGI